MRQDILDKNKAAWNAIADDWFGTTALPTYGVMIPEETTLCLFGDVAGKRVLDIGCGSGHSLKYLGDRGAAELWGLDLSEKQIENAGGFLRQSGYAPHLFVSPMEEDPGLPTEYFDVVYSIYALGWTVDMDQTLARIASYLKKDGILIFSWDHPFMHCVDLEGERLVFSGSYHEPEAFASSKGGNPVFMFNRRLSDYINPLAKAGFAVERLVEETEPAALERDGAVHSKYYSPLKARHFPLSFVIKARKL